MPDIKQLARIAGIDAERTASDLFGMAVEQFASGPINSALRAVTGRAEQPVGNRNDGFWHATSYAHSLANSQFRPKLKFMFRVEFLFKPEIIRDFGVEGAAWAKNFTFMVKSVDRPKYDFEYEDVNMYNFRTKILREIKGRDLTMTFLDDVGNNVHEFFRFMMMVYSPITRRSVNSSNDIAQAYATYSTGNGMMFSDNLGNTQDFAHRGAIDTDVGNAIQAIKVTQMFMKPANGPNAMDTNAKEVAFFFINPRIMSFDLDDVNHEANEANMFSMQFSYDFMIMGEQQILESSPIEKSLPPIGTAPSEPTPSSSAALNRQGSPEGNNNPFTKILSNIGGRAAQKITNEIIGRRIRQVPGLGAVADTLGSLASGITRDSINGISSRVNQSLARPSRAVVSDSATAGAANVSYTASTGAFGPGQPTPRSGTGI